MREQICHCFQRFGRAVGASREIQDQASAADSADSAAQRGEWSLLRAFGAHSFSNAVEQAIADCACRFGRHVAQCDASSTGGHNELHFARQSDQQVLNLDGIVRHDFSRDYREMQFFEKLADRRP